MLLSRWFRLLHRFSISIILKSIHLFDLAPINQDIKLFLGKKKNIIKEELVFERSLFPFKSIVTSCVSFQTLANFKIIKTCHWHPQTTCPNGYNHWFQ